MQPVRYNISLLVDPDRNLIPGTTTISLWVYQPTKFIILHVGNQNITAVSVRLYKIVSQFFVPDFNFFVVEVNQCLLPNETISITIDYTIPLNKYSADKNVSPAFLPFQNGRQFLGDANKMQRILFESTENGSYSRNFLFRSSFGYAKYFTPCLDSPKHKSMFLITLKYPRSYQLISDMKMVETTSFSDSSFGKNCSRFHIHLHQGGGGGGVFI